MQEQTEESQPAEQPAPPILTILCRSEYIPEALVADFTAQTGITVVTADPADYPDLTAADGSYDLALVDSLWLPLLIDEGALAEIDRPAIPNSAAISQPFSAVPFDPDGTFCIPFLWGTFGIVVNRSVVTDTNIEWEILFDHRFSGKIDMPDDVRLPLEAALRSLGASLGEADTDALNRATDLLYEQRKTVRGYFQIPEIIDHLAEGSSYISCIDNPSAFLAIKSNSALEYIVPASGAPLWLLVWVIPATSENPGDARSFIDFFLAPGRIAAVSNANRVANAIVDSRPYLDDTLINTAMIILSDDMLARCRLPEPIDLETENLMMRLRDDFMFK
ncbi:MAG: spermidine/putrescine ABC transporter substrate-binding protein [Deltaproteobacteria bacterium]|nr:spermidine/putrescine ABC transporter substrate-binding protein [Candidatus Zymogenaceae bacterium]